MTTGNRVEVAKHNLGYIIYLPKAAHGNEWNVHNAETFDQMVAVLSKHFTEAKP